MTDDRCTCWECNPLNRDATWRQVDREWSKRWKSDQQANERQVAELTEMLTAATDTAIQRGKTIDKVRAMVEGAGGTLVDLSPYGYDLLAILDGGDGG